MGYSRSPETVARMSPVLDKILNARGNSTVLQLKTENPKRLAYNIRSAMNAAEVNDIPPYSTMRSSFKIKERYDLSLVEFQFPVPGATDEVMRSTVMLDSPHPSAVADAMRHAVMSDVNTVACESRPSEEQMKMIYKLVQGKYPEWMLVLAGDGIAITLREARSDILQEWVPK